MADSTYSPRLRTGVVLCGAGTAGAYQAGVLRALLEAGIKIDVLAAHGPGVVTALAVAIDGGARLWDPSGPWTNRRLRHAYRWRGSLRFGMWGLLVSIIVLLSPTVVLAFAAVTYAVSVLAALVNLPSASTRLVGWYQRSIELLFSPPILPTMLPRALVLALLIVAAVIGVAAFHAARSERSRRRATGAFWWRLLGSPLDATEPGATLVDTLWALVRGASKEPTPAAAEIGRRYVDVLADNFGQPGFREVVIAVHDLDGRRDLVGALLPPQPRAAFEARRSGITSREAEALDFTGPQRALLMDFAIGALRLPIATPPHMMTFTSDGFWRGERHRICDRPELAVRLIDELAGIGVEQVILISAATPPATPHSMRAEPLGLGARLGEVVRSMEAAALQDASSAAGSRFSGVFVIRPDHNPIGPFEFAGAYDEGSDRERTVGELMEQGYADAYRSFIEPVVAAGERIGV